MTNFIATIRHSSIAQAPELRLTGTLAAAKRAATVRFGDGFEDHEIMIFDARGDIVAARRIGSKRWQDRA